MRFGDEGHRGPMIQVDGLYKTYSRGPNSAAALDDVSFKVAQGEIFGVLGPSGAGKSTLIRCLNLLEQPTSGRIQVAGTDLARLRASDLRMQRQRIGMIFQHFYLLHSRTVADNVALPLEIQGGLSRLERRRRVSDLLDLVGLSGCADVFPSQLSGGQKQRVGVARALAADPAVLLSDEATSALDAEATAAVLELLRDINRRLGVTIVLITHELDVVKSICTSAALLEQGRLVETGRIADLVADSSSRLGRLLLPGRYPEAPKQGLVFDLIFADAEASSPTLTALAGALNVRVQLLAGGIESVAGRRVGRLQIAVTAADRAPDSAAVLNFLIAGGVQVAPA
jgi:D-methionine transport system ATP-binding protein